MSVRCMLFCMFCNYYLVVFVVFFFKQKTAYEMRISDWSSDVCSSDLRCLSGLYFNFEDIIKNNEGNWMNQSSVAKYYINPPYEARLVNESRRRGGEDWLSILGNAFTMEEGDYELVDITIRINPNDFGLIEGEDRKSTRLNSSH